MYEIKQRRLVGAYPSRLPQQRGYPTDWIKRKVRPSGQIKWKGHELRISDALVGYEIGFRPVAEDKWEIYFEDNGAECAA